jgi:micrococcal nuclease
MIWTFANCKVLRVIDGDSFECDVDIGFDIHTTKIVRVRGINSPERKNPTKDAGDNALLLAKELLLGGLVTLRSHGWDKYRRIEADVILSDGRDFGTVMIANGGAVVYK